MPKIRSGGKPIKPSAPVQEQEQETFTITVENSPKPLRIEMAPLKSPRHKAGWELMQQPQRHTLFYGGARAGKTVLILRAMVFRALSAQCRQCILRLRRAAIVPSIVYDSFPKVMDLFFKEVHYRIDKQLGCIFLPGGSEIWFGGLDDKQRVDKILGNEYVTMYFNECSQIPYASFVQGMSRLAQVIVYTDSKGKERTMRQRAFLDLNPVGESHWTNKLFVLHREPITNRELPNGDDYKFMKLNPVDNKENLSPEFLASLQLMPPKERQRFWEGNYQNETLGALWSLEGIERLRVARADVPKLRRIVVAVDPSGAKNALDQTHDAIGIVVCGLGEDGHGYLLADYTILDHPNVWARAAVSAFRTFEADCIVGEINYGGALVEHAIHTVDPSVPFKEVKASRGKAVRAEPIAALASVKDIVGDGQPGPSGWRIHHVGDPDETGQLSRFAELESELCDFTNLGYVGERSPNRADAYVWGFTELMVKGNAQGWVDYYGARAAAANPDAILPAASGAVVKKAPAAPVELKAPRPYMDFCMPDGKRYRSDPHAKLTAEARHSEMLIKAGCELA